MNFLPAWNNPSKPPRLWQREALDVVRRHLSQWGGGPAPAVISAIMGSGKALLISEICASSVLGQNEMIVVSTPSEYLVRQLLRTIIARVNESECRKTVGVWYGRGKRMGDIVVTCTPSMNGLASTMKSYGKTCRIWIADEAHRTEAATIKKAHRSLQPWASLGFSATVYRACRHETLSLYSAKLFEYGADRALRDKVVVPWLVVPWTGAQTGIDDACISMIKGMEGPGIVNALTTGEADDFANKLIGAGISAASIHSKKPWREHDVLVEDLLAGRLRCLVHCNMLSEGADYPWLRWLCLRRNVDSRVRFIQEVGRALRSYPGKIEAVLLDPNDLFGSFRISYEEALGEQSFEEIAEDGDPQELAEKIRTIPEAKSLTLTELVIRRIAVAAEAAGMLPDRKVLPKAFRNDKPTGLQAAAILAFWNRGKRFVPANWMAVCEECVSRRRKIRRGFASDFSYVLAAICDCERFPPISTRGAVLQEGNAPEGEVEFDVPNDGILPFKDWITGLNHGPE